MTPELREMLAQLETLQQSIKERQAFEHDQALGQIHEIMLSHSITLEEIQQAFSPARKRLTKGKRKAPTPKYRDPESGAEWSGQGRAPSWIKDQPREKFLIAA